MTKNIVVEPCNRPKIEDQKVEIVERKGLGHPDTLADGTSEVVSRALSKEYLDKIGRVLHHNTDKVLIVGGSADPQFKGGEIEKPIYVVVAGRGTAQAGEKNIAVNEIAKRATKEYLDDSVRYLDVENHLEVKSRIGSGSVDLKSVFDRQGVPSSNDTSIGAAYAPLSETEQLALKTENKLNSDGFKDKFPPVGEDIKVMAYREDSHINLTVAMATVSQVLDDLDHYMSLKEDVKDSIIDLAEDITDKPIDVHLNIADEPEKGVIYKTVTGTSAEQGDDGMTGRGNRVNGLITFDRPMSLEAAAGKNPVSHVGKLYNLLSKEVAEEIADLEGVEEVFVKTLSQIGSPIDQPHILNIRLIPEEGKILSDLRGDAESIADEHLKNIGDMSKKVIEGKLKVY